MCRQDSISILDLAGYQQYGSPIQVNPGMQNFITSLREKNIFRFIQPKIKPMLQR